MTTIICGTNRKNSNSAIVGGIYQQMMKDVGHTANLVNLQHLPDDFIKSALYEVAGTNEHFNPVRELMAQSDKFVFIVPEYNGSFPGVLKTFIDGLKFPGTFTGKKSALVGISSGIQGGVLAMSHLTDILNYCGTNVLAQKPKLSGIEKNLKDGKITNPLYVQLLEEQIRAFVAY